LKIHTTHKSDFRPHHFTVPANVRIILASQSPRRRQLLEQLGLSFEVMVLKDLPEAYPPEMPVTEIPEFLASQKADAYAELLSQGNTIVITADTIVALNKQVLGKPANRQEAIDMLQLLSGKIHKVITGVAISSKDNQITFAAHTNVWFKQLSTEEIEYYVDHYQPYDKAGAYGIQEWIGMIGIEKVEGSYYNVVGLPVQKLYTELMSFIDNNIPDSST
jgi:septum formation protein